MKTLNSQQRRIDNSNNDRLDRIAKRKQEIEALSHPYAKEIDTCDELITYCRRQKKKAGLEQLDADQVA